MLASALQIVGLACVCAAAALYVPLLGLAVTGASIVACGVALERR